MAEFDLEISNDNIPVLKNFETIKKGVIAYLDNLKIEKIDISTEIGYLEAGSKRTLLNKLVKKISNERKHIEEIRLGDFKSQVMEIEKILKNSSDKINDLINEHDNKVLIKAITVSFANKKQKELVIEFLNKNEIKWR